MVDDFLLIPGSQLEIIQGEEGSLPQEHIAQAFASRQDHVLHNAGPSRRLGKIRAVFFQDLAGMAPFPPGPPVLRHQTAQVLLILGTQAFQTVRQEGIVLVFLKGLEDHPVISWLSRWSRVRRWGSSGSAAFWMSTLQRGSRKIRRCEAAGPVHRPCRFPGNPAPGARPDPGSCLFFRLRS